MELRRIFVARIGLMPALMLPACSAEPDTSMDDYELVQDGDSEDGTIGTLDQALACGGGGEGQWQCSVSWGAKTTQRMIKGPTDFECACGLPFHTCGESWVDIVGGLSQSCDDHSDSFFGPIQGEWHGCTAASGMQLSTGDRAIAGINQGWDRWPATWRGGTYFGDLSWLSRSDNMRGPFATIYDLDTCANKQVINSLFWPNFTITAQLVAGDPSAAVHNPDAYASATWHLSGSTPPLCSDQDGVLADSGELSGPKRPPVCADLVVDGTFSCQYFPSTPYECPAPGPRRPILELMHSEI